MQTKDLFKLVSAFNPCGDQPKAIEKLSEGILSGQRFQVLLGITGSGKTFTMAHTIQKVQRPTLVLAHNKTLAAQLYQEFKEFFPENAVEYFVSYYDYYQPEAYIPRSNTYIEKDMAINDRIDRMRLSATRSLFERRDVIIVASVSCIYGLGMPEYYKEMNLSLKKGDCIDLDNFLIQLVHIHYERNDYDLVRSKFRVRGDVVEVFPAYEESVAIRIEFLGDEIEKISEIDPLTGKTSKVLDKIIIYPASHYVMPEEICQLAVEDIKKELEERKKYFEEENLLIEKQRIHERTLYDLEMIREIGFCKGIENYSRHFSRRQAGNPPPTLLDYFPDDFLVIIDESHQTLPQLHAMCNGDRARKKNLVDFGFRLPSAYDNRPLTFKETFEKVGQVIFVSATPGVWEQEQAEGKVIEQVIRPTGLLDPLITVKPAATQIDDVIEEIHRTVEKGFRVLVTTLTKKLAEELSDYLKELDIKAKYLHSEIKTIERLNIIRGLRQQTFDVLVGINLLREGLDIPEVALIAILDADKEGFLRSETSLIQMCGRAARNVEGHVIMYADKMTSAIKNTLAITEKRRKKQILYNEKNHIVPKTIFRKLQDEFLPMELMKTEEDKKRTQGSLSLKELKEKIEMCKDQMKRAAQSMDFEKAAHFRDEMFKYQSLELDLL